ncbi:type II toxin-antitoxin system RelE/ParE family toxin [bacterium]|nr:type II toxin-antitoxin system RelE/ParE family toxin [bacterium]
MFKASVEKLSKFPNLGKHKIGINDKDILIFTVKQRYSIAYKIINDSIVILRVLSRYQDVFAIL